MVKFLSIELRFLFPSASFISNGDSFLLYLYRTSYICLNLTLYLLSYLCPNCSFPHCANFGNSEGGAYFTLDPVLPIGKTGLMKTIHFCLSSRLHSRFHFIQEACLPPQVLPQAPPLPPLDSGLIHMSGLLTWICIFICLYSYVCLQRLKKVDLVCLVACSHHLGNAWHHS